MKNVTKTVVTVLLIMLLTNVLAEPVWAQEDRWQALNQQVVQLYQQAYYTEAISVAKEALRVAEVTFGPDDPNTAASLNNLATLYCAQGKYTEAEPLYRRTLVISEKALGPEHPDVAISLNNLAELYRSQGNYSETEPLYRRALVISEKALGPEHPDVATSLNNLALLYSSQGKYAAAESLYRRVLTIREKVLGPEHPDMATGLNNLAALYELQGNYTDAEPLYCRALAIYEKALEPEHPDVALSLNNLAGLYISQGNFAAAEPLCRRALVIREKTLGPEHPDMASSLKNLAELYCAQGKYAEAEPLYRRALAIWEKALGPEHPGVAQNLNNLALLYESQGNYAEAEPLYYRALTIWEKALGPEHPAVAASLNNLALLYESQGNYAEAETQYCRALMIFEKALGSDHPNVAANLNNLAALLNLQGKYTKAEPLYHRALAILEKALGAEHPDVAASLNNLAVLLVASDRPAQALPLTTRSLAIDDHTIDNIFSITSEREKFVFLRTIQGNFDALLSLITLELPTNSETAGAGLDATLRRKGLVLEALSRERLALATSTAPQVARTAQQLQKVSSRLATITLAGPADKGLDAYRQSLAELEAEKERLENELTRLSGAYAAYRQSRQADCQNVAQALPAGSALVEFVCPKMFNFKAKGAEKNWGESRYLAFVLPASRAPKPLLVDLGSAEAIDEAVQEFLQEIAQTTKQISQLGEIGEEQNVTEKGKQLYKLIVAPIEKAISTVNTIYFSPDGDLNLIPFGALKDATDTYLAEKYQINYLSSGRDLIRFSKDIKSGKDIVIMTAPDYDLSSAFRSPQHVKPTEEADQFALRGETNRRLTDLRDVYWNSLPNTKNEAEQIAKMFPRKNTHLYVGREASEETFVQLKSPKILHIATHGFFLQDVDKSLLYEQQDRFRGFQFAENSPFSRSAVNIENPLLRSGLVLAGANNLGKEELPDGIDDGILTAYEISGMNLWGTNLVVLSACETGIGEIHRGEGVFGLRRAFQLAGAKTVVMSLWKVPDQETQELMVEFYKRMQTGEGKARALQNAQLEMMKQRREKYGAAHPFYWGAFVCVGEP